MQLKKYIGKVFYLSGVLFKSRYLFPDPIPIVPGIL